MEITQGNKIKFTNTTSGPTAGILVEWDFEGGNEIGLTGPFDDRIVEYTIPNSIGYSVTLTLTRNNKKISKKISNLIKVKPEMLDVTLTKDKDGILPMDNSDLIYTVTSGDNINEYKWYVPGATAGVTGGYQKNISSTDWYKITGTYIGNAYSKYIENPKVMVTSNIGNTKYSNMLTVEYSKNGPDEDINFLNIDIINYKQGFQKENYYLAERVRIDKKILCFSGSIVGGIPYILDNLYFRSNLEKMYYRSSSMDIEYGVVSGNIIVDPKILDQIYDITDIDYSQLRNKEFYIDGHYIRTGDIKKYLMGKIHFYDSDDTLNKYSYRNIYDIESSDYLIESIFNETGVASQSSRSLELDPKLLPLGEILNLKQNDFIVGCCLPRYKYVKNDVKLYFDIYVNRGNKSIKDSILLDTIEIIMSDENDNSLDNFMNADTIAIKIRSILDTKIYNGYALSECIYVESDPKHAWNYNAKKSLEYTNQWPGLKIAIVDNTKELIHKGKSGSIVKIRIRDNFNDLNNIANTVAAGFDIFDKTKIDKIIRRTNYRGNWLCLKYNYIINPAQMLNEEAEPLRGFSYGSI